MIGSIIRALAGALEWLGIRERRAEEADDEATGAMKQRHADLVEEIRKLEGQLDEAIKHREDVWRDRARDKRF